MSLESAIKANTEAVLALIEVLKSNKPVDAVASKPIKPTEVVPVINGEPAPEITFESHIRPLAMQALKNDRDAGKAFINALIKKYGATKLLSEVKDVQNLLKIEDELKAHLAGSKK